MIFSSKLVLISQSVVIESSACLALEAVVGVCGVSVVCDDGHGSFINGVASNMWSRVFRQLGHPLAVFLHGTKHLSAHGLRQGGETSLIRHVNLGLALALLRVVLIHDVHGVAHGYHLSANLSTSQFGLRTYYPQINLLDLSNLAYSFENTIPALQPLCNAWKLESSLSWQRWVA